MMVQVQPGQAVSGPHAPDTKVVQSDAQIAILGAIAQRFVKTTDRQQVCAPGTCIASDEDVSWGQGIEKARQATMWG